MLTEEQTGVELKLGPGINRNELIPSFCILMQLIFHNQLICIDDLSHTHTHPCPSGPSRGMFSINAAVIQVVMAIVMLLKVHALHISVSLCVCVCCSGRTKRERKTLLQGPDTPS